MAVTDPVRTGSASSSSPWHALAPQAVLERLDASKRGLSTEEAQRRRSHYGPNRITPPRRRGAIQRFLAQFHNVLIYILLLAATVTAALGHWVDTGVILGVVVINAAIGFLQEDKAERALEAIRNLLSPRTSALRDGQHISLAAEELVPGDVVFLQSGDKVPADLRLLQVHNLHIDEASLTGESVPVAKDPAPVGESVSLGDRLGVAFSGTLVTSGQATGVVVATGDATEIGQVSTMLAGVTTLQTPLLTQMAHFGRWLSAAIVALAATLFAFGTLIRDYPGPDMFLAAVGLAVAAIPEGLPAIITITLAVGVQAMAQRQAIIRLLPAVETLGSVTVICSDKTGTLTHNEMTVTTVATVERSVAVSGAGYEPHGGFSDDDGNLAPNDYPQLLEIARAGLLCNDAHVELEDDGWRMEGDPTEGALVTLARKAGLEPHLEAEERPRTDTIPFESEHRFMATLHHDHAGHGFVFVKGAPEQILTMCTRQRRAGEDEPLDLAFWHHQAETIANRGQRVLALAFREAQPSTRQLTFAEVGTGLTLLGLVGMIDPPREEAIRAVTDCQSAGIRVKMITGDHAATARTIGKQLGVGDGRTALTGPEIDALSPEELQAAAHEVDVFARVSPEHKLHLVEALQDLDQVVAMTGDGVNDAPALKRANVGVAMGQKGTEVAKEAADMVLADDNFASIVAAIREGRTVYDNIKKSLLFILPTNGGEAFIIMVAILLGRELPITPIQILWINMVTAITLGLSLAFESAERGVMRRPPRDPGEPVLSGFLVFRIGFVSAILVTGTFGLFLWERTQGTSLPIAQTTAVNLLVAFEAFYLFSTRSIRAPLRRAEDFLGNPYVLYAITTVIGLQLLFTYAPVLQSLFGTTALGFGTWGLILGVALVILPLVEADKALRRHPIPIERPSPRPARAMDATHHATSVELSQGERVRAQLGQGHDPGALIADFRRRFWVSLALTVPILALSPMMLQSFLGMEAVLAFPGDRYVLFGLSAVLFVYGGWPFLTGLASELEQRQPGMMTPIALAISVAFFYSEAVVFGLAGRVFFWELAILVDVMLLGHWLEMRSVMGISGALEAHGRRYGGHDPGALIADFRRRFWVSLALTVPILALSPMMLQSFLGMEAVLAFPGDRYVLFGLSAVLFVYGGWPFLTGLASELEQRQPGMMTLIALAISVAFFYSEAVVFGLAGRVFFWELAILVDVMLLGHWLEMRSVMGTRVLWKRWFD